MANGSLLLAAWDRFAASPRSSSRLAIIDSAGAHGFAALDLAARRIAGALLAAGPPNATTPRASLSGARIALLAPPGAAFVEAFFGILLAGGAVVVLSTLHPAAETAYFCGDADVERVLVSRELEALVSHVDRSTLTIERARETAEPARAAVSARAPALQLYTSGTTGKPKGAVLTHENLGVQQALLRDAWGFCEDDVLLHTLPLHHMHGLAIALLTALGAGATTRMRPLFDATATWEAMGESSIFMAVPTIYAKLLAAFDAADGDTRARWSSHARDLRLATSGSAALPVTLASRWRAIAGSYPLERFGMTEIGVGLANPLVGERRPGSVGRPLPSVETRIEDGELWIAGPSVFAGYFQRDDATRAAFVDDGATRWFRTGDTVERADDGYFRILGRTSVDILKSGGYKLSALEIEEVLREHPAVLEVAVVGVPDETWGDRVVACVVARGGHEDACSEELLRAFAKTKLAPYKVPRAVVRLEELPRNAIGKVVKPELVKLLGAR